MHNNIMCIIIICSVYFGMRRGKDKENNYARIRYDENV